MRLACWSMGHGAFAVVQSGRFARLGCSVWAVFRSGLTRGLVVRITGWRVRVYPFMVSLGIVPLLAPRWFCGQAQGLPVPVDPPVWPLVPPGRRPHRLIAVHGRTAGPRAGSRIRPCHHRATAVQPPCNRRATGPAPANPRRGRSAGAVAGANVFERWLEFPELPLRVGLQSHGKSGVQTNRQCHLVGSQS